MTPRHRQHLYDKYYRLYLNHARWPPTTPKGQAFYCGDGWFKLIAAVSQKIEDHAALHKLTVSAIDVREQHRSLIFRVRGGDAEIEALVLDAEYFSREICERCGSDNRAHEIRFELDRCCAKCGYALWNPRFLGGREPRDSSGT